MARKIGVIQKVETRETYLGTPYKIVTIDNKVYGCFEKDLFEKLIVGVNLYFDIEEGKNGYLNIKKANIVGVNDQVDTNGGVVASPLSPPSLPEEITDKFKLLERKIDVLEKQLFNHLCDEWGHKL